MFPCVIQYERCGAGAHWNPRSRGQAIFSHRGDPIGRNGVGFNNPAIPRRRREIRVPCNVEGRAVRQDCGDDGVVLARRARLRGVDAGRDRHRRSGPVKDIRRRHREEIHRRRVLRDVAASRVDPAREVAASQWQVSRRSGTRPSRAVACEEVA